MSKFEQMLRFWMAGFGVDQETADKICANRRIADDIQRKDSGGIIQDLDSAIFESHVTGECRELLEAFRDPGEKLMLIMVLK